MGSRDALLDLTRAAILPSIFRGLRESSDFFLSLGSDVAASLLASTCRRPLEEAARGGFGALGEPFLAARDAIAALSSSSSSVDGEISSSDSRRGSGAGCLVACSCCCCCGCWGLSFQDMAFFLSNDSTGP